MWNLIWKTNNAFITYHGEKQSLNSKKKKITFCKIACTLYIRSNFGPIQNNKFNVILTNSVFYLLMVNIRDNKFRGSNLNDRYSEINHSLIFSFKNDSYQQIERLQWCRYASYTFLIEQLLFLTCFNLLRKLNLLC